MTNAPRGRVQIEPSPKRVRVVFDAKVVADTLAPMLVWEGPYYPTYYFPPADVDTTMLQQTAETRRSPSRGDASILDVVGADRTAPGAVFHHIGAKFTDLAGCYSFDWKSMDQWLEEDTEVFVHAKDPYTRIDTRQSSRHIEVFVDDVLVADTTRATMLYETKHPTRYYMPLEDLKQDLLEPSEHTTQCPYKGTASYYSLQTANALHENLIWYYPDPIPESQDIKDLVAFYNERAKIVIDGVEAA